MKDQEFVEEEPKVSSKINEDSRLTRLKMLSEDKLREIFIKLGFTGENDDEYNKKHFHGNKEWLDKFDKEVGLAIFDKYGISEKK